MQGRMVSDNLPRAHHKAIAVWDGVEERYIVKC